MAWIRVGSLLKLGWPLCFQANKADAVTLDGGLVYEAGQGPNKLRPIVAEVYGTQAGEFSLEIQKLGWPWSWPWAPCSQRGCVVEVGSQIAFHLQGSEVLGPLGQMPPPVREDMCVLPGGQSGPEEKVAYSSPFHPGKVKVGCFSLSKAFNYPVKSFQFSLSLCRATNLLLCCGHSQEGHQLSAQPTTRLEVLPHRPWQVRWMEHPDGYPSSILELGRAT